LLNNLIKAGVSLLVACADPQQGPAPFILSIKEGVLLFVAGAGPQQDLASYTGSVEEYKLFAISA
jgi:hypothetical protein